MRFVIQVVSHADVVIEGQVHGQIGRGFMVLIGVGQEDNEAIADKMVQKMLGLRIFPDENGKTNLSLKDGGGLFFQETVLPLPRQAHQTMPSASMNMWWIDAGNL